MPAFPDKLFLPGVSPKKESFFIMLLIMFSGAVSVFGQDINNVKSSIPANSKIVNADLFGNQKNFIENKGQYGDVMKGHEQMGHILFGYEGLGMPVLFTAKGLIHLQRKAEKLSHEEEEKLERQGAKEEEIEHKKNITDKTITAEWMGANANVEIITEDQTINYHTYGMLTEKAFGYKKIIYKNIYDGIDIVYSFINNTKSGFEYSILAKAGANLNAVKMKIGGDVKNIKINGKGNLIIKSDIDGIEETIPVSYYSDKIVNKNISDVKTKYKISSYEISFSFPNSYDSTKAIILDPFVSGTSNLTGTFAGKAIDVDYDYEGNVYVAGGGTTNQFGTASHSHAKYNSAGVLQWTFNGVLTIPTWQALYYYGGWVVDKASGALYIGQGFSFPGFRVIRVSTTGLYDNYISTANSAFQENWKMYWFCNNGNPQIICAGGGTTANNNIAICSPPSTTLLSSANLTGAAAAFQDMSDLVIDPVTNSLYSIYASGIDPTIRNRIFKHNPPYSAATTVWSALSGFTVLGEILNRPYLGGTYADNSSNILAINANYLFYWDGKSLEAINKTTGAIAGAPLTLAPNIALNQGGIVADACDNVFIGNTNGTIKVYKFNGTTFDDAAAADINIPGFSTNVYDLALDESKKLLYASGDGFVASFDVTAYCPTTIYTVNVVPNCVTASATATVSPAAPAGSTITYTLFIGTTQIATNTTGIFTGLNPNVTYTIVATINLACSGVQASTNFILPGPTITFTQTNTTCGASTGSITATGSGTPGPYSYSLNGGAFQPTGNFAGLAAGIYTLVVQGAGGCPNDTVITILNSNGPILTYTQTNATCGNNTGTVTANGTGGTAPLQYSINGGTTYQTGNFFTGLVAGQYILVVKDAAGCTNRTIITITTSPVVALSAIPASATCGQNNGTITAFGSGGTAPLQYSVNGNIFQAGNSFTGLTPGVYTVTVKDAIGCIKTATVTVDNFPAPTVTATSTAATCNNINGSITATGSNGLAPYQYSINGGITYQPGNIFTGLAPGVYTITIKDATGCTSTVTATIGSTNAPSVTAVATISSCAANTGTITATGSGGAAPYQYSINGATFFASNVFNSLAPGNYVVYIKDVNGCIGTVRVVVGAIAGPSITAVATPASCIANDGTITATGTGGTAPLQYSINGVTYGVATFFTGLSAGIYTVYVKDANGCIKTTTIIVASASGLTLTVSPITSSCSGNNGVITATATGGTAPLQYSINGVTYQASNIFNGLASGTYTVYVKDANGCIVTKQAIITQVAGPSFTLSVQQNATCGTANGVMRVTTSGGVAPLTYNIDGGAFQPTPIFINVAPGLHTIIVKDAAGCTALPQPVTITNSGTGTAITDVTFTVNGVLACTGEGRIKNLKGVPTGGGRNYEFSLDGGPFTTANQFRPVSTGYHTITARIVGSVCAVTRIAQIGVGTPATATATSTASGCGQSTGTITLTGVGVNTPYHASIDNGVTWTTFDPTTTFTNLAPATYPIIIADDADFKAGPPDIPGACLTTIFVIVPSTGGPSISTTQVNPNCTSNTGSITATGGGGTAPYTYSIDGGPYTSSGVFNNLAPGAHAITVKDATGCINGANITLANASVPTVTANLLSTSCGLNNGTITATGTGGTAPLEYSINGTVYLSSNVFTGLTPGNYTLYVRDASRCFSSIPVTIANTPLPHADAFTIAATCNNNDGSVLAEGSLGETPYTFSIDGTAYQSSSTFSNLAAGFYTVSTKDARGCITTTGVTVDNIGALTFTATTTSATCGNATGSITVTASGGSGSYQYSKDGGLTFQASNIFPNLTPGTYAVVAKDLNNGCIASDAILVPNINGPQTLTAVIVNAACANADGSITATATGGTAPYQYSRDGITYQASNILNGVPAGSYTLFVKDANGCIKTLLVTVLNLPGPAITATASPTSCGSNDGTITVNATGGTLLLIYSKDGGVTYQASNIFTGLAAGTYSIVVKDARNCLSTPVNIVVSVIGSSVAPTFNPIGPLCQNSVPPVLPPSSSNGITGTWNPLTISTTIAGSFPYIFTPGAGQCATPVIINITITPLPTAAISYASPFCGNNAIVQPVTLTGTTGGTYSSAPAGLTLNTATGAIISNTSTPGTYTVSYTIAASGGCAIVTATASVTITALPVATINYASSPYCSNAGTATVTLTGTTGGTYSSAPAGLTLNATTGAITLGTSTAGTYTVTYTIAAAGGCPAVTATTSVAVTALPIATINYAGSPYCSNAGTATVTFSGTIGGTYSSAPAGLTINTITGAITPSTSTPGTYTVTYTIAAAGGCPAFSTPASVTINPLLSPTINCGASTTSSVTFNWAAATGAIGYTISYQVNTNPIVNAGAIGNVVTYSVTGLSGGDNVTITVTPAGGAGTCFTSATTTCIATVCTPPTANISYASPFCVNITAPQPVTLTGTGTFTGGTYSSAPAGLSINSTTGAITASTSIPGSYIVTYTIAASSGCAAVTATAPITINAKPLPIIIYHN